jgi:hypothetical protein
MWFFLPSGILLGLAAAGAGPAGIVAGVAPLLATFLAASAFYNWLWRLLVGGIACALLPLPAVPGATALLLLAAFNVPTFALLGVRSPEPEVRAPSFPAET